MRDHRGPGQSWQWSWEAFLTWVLVQEKNPGVIVDRFLKTLEQRLWRLYVYSWSESRKGLKTSKHFYVQFYVCNSSQLKKIKKKVIDISEKSNSNNNRG